MMFNKIKVIAIQMAVFLVLISGVEIAARLIETKAPHVSMDLRLSPYTMFHMPAGAPANGGYVWQDIFTKERVPSTLSFNNFGYAELFDYDMFPDTGYLSKYAKQPGEKLVVITGASVVHGVGATSMQNTLPKQLEKYLNKHTNGPRYRVLNMAMGSWIAYQQFIGLSMFAKPLNPDWVVVMDGHNDAGLACGYGTGPGNPLGWPKMMYFSQGSKMQEGMISILSRHSALVRLVTGEEPQGARSPDQLIYRKEYASHPYALALKDLTFAVQDQQVRFYLEAQKNVIDLFNHSNILLSLQPVMYDNALTPLYRKSTNPDGSARDEAAMEKEMSDYMQKMGEKPCSPELSPQLLAYFLNRAHPRLKELASKAGGENPKRHIFYANTEWTMPVEEKLRKPYFVDNAHMSDKGQERVGVFFAEIILSLEQKKSFNYSAFIERHKQ